MSSKGVVRKYWRYIVVSLALLVGVTILSQKGFASNSWTLLDPLNVPVTPVTHSNGGFNHTWQSVEGAITDTDTPTSTETPTSTSTPAGSVTPTPAMLLVGHVDREGIPPGSRNVQPVSLTLTMGSTRIDYPTQNTDESGSFAVSVDGLASGTYNYRVKDPKFLAKAGTVALTGAPITQLEIGFMSGGDGNNDNVGDGIDFSIFRAAFNATCGQPDYDARADFDNNCIVGIDDFEICKNVFGKLGAPPDSAVPPSSGDAFLSLQPGSAGNCSAPPNGGTVQVGCRFVLDLMVNMGSVPDGVAMQSYLTFTSSILQNARVSSIASSCVLINTATQDTTIFDAGLQIGVCNGPAPCTFGAGTVDAGSFAHAQGDLSNCPTGCGGTFRVARIGLCAVASGQAVFHWDFSPPAARNRHSAIVDVNGNMVQDQSLFTDYVINVGVPTNTRTITPTPTPTSTPTNTPTNSPTPGVRNLVGHVAWQLIPQNDPRSVLPITLTLKLGTLEVNYPQQNTDPGGFFTVSVSTLPLGTYTWRVQAPDGPPFGNFTAGFLANCGTVALAGAPQTNMENSQIYNAAGCTTAPGCIRGGDANNTNIINIEDFDVFKSDFNQAGIRRADFDYNQIVTMADFNILKNTFNQVGCSAR